MITFVKKVNHGRREAMVAFLRGHFRYHTMNSWNASSSYANNVKITRLGLSTEEEDKCFALLDVKGCMDPVSWLLDDWASEHDQLWQVGFNGRSSGYLVLYQGGKDYRNASTASCDTCFRRTYHKTETPCNQNGCAGTLKILAKPIPRIVTWPGKSTDQGEDFEEWTMEALKERVDLVQDFDAVCDDAVRRLVDTAMTHDIVEETVLVPRTFKVLRPKE